MEFDFVVKDMDINTGELIVAILNYRDAVRLTISKGDRVLLRNGDKKIYAVINISETAKAVPKGRIGLFEETLKALCVKHNENVTLKVSSLPKSLDYIEKKLNGVKLCEDELKIIVRDICSNKLTNIEKTYFVAAAYGNGMTLSETADYTKAIVSSGNVMKFKGKVFDKHCIGGIPNNRTTMILVPILASAGITIPKSSSRTITSPAGTADVMEVFSNILLKPKKIKDIVKRINGCIVWGGSMGLAPADRKIINVRIPLSINSDELVIASILAKKMSVGANSVLIDIPIGSRAKIKTKKEAGELGAKFKKVGRKLGMHIEIMLTSGDAPLGRGVGPLLEARDVMEVLKGEGPKDLREKSLKMAALMLKMAGKKRGYNLAKKILDSGAAYEKMQQIIKLQGKQKKKFKLGKYTFTKKSSKKGKVRLIDVELISKTAKLAGAPYEKGAGMYLYKQIGENVKKGEGLYIIYSASKERLKQAVSVKSPYDIA